MMNVGLQRVGLSSRGIWGVCLEIVEGPFFLFALSLIAAEGMEMGRGERGRESIHVGDRIANSMGAFVPVLVRLGGCND